MAAYKVLIVDDEMVIRYGLASCIDWAKEGCELIGEASNGAAAMQIIQEQPVDILITDIKMPVMDGLELVRQAKADLPAIKVIIISSYNDFEYAREAVKLGVVVDYLLKPTMEPQDLVKILHTCKSRLEEEAEHVRETSLYQQQERQKQREGMEYRIKRLLGGHPIQPDELPNWMKEPLALAVWKQDGPAVRKQENGLDKLLQVEAAQEKLLSWSEEGLAVITGEDELVTVYPDRIGGAEADVKRFHKRLQNEETFYFTVGVSPSITHYETLGNAYTWAQLALEQSFYDGRRKCYTGTIPSAAPAGEPPQEEWLALKEQFSRTLAASDREASGSLLDETFARWEQKTLPKAEVVRQAQSLQTLMSSRYAGLNVEEMAKHMFDNLQSVRHVLTLDELKTVLKQQFQLLWDADYIPVVATSDVGSAHAVQLALAYIQERYRGELSLREVADHVHMSKNYFSEQFKRLTGLNFIDYVIRLRIQYAKRLLRTTSLRIYDIGNQAGFQSPKHFLKLFKREAACTPAEYRNQSLRE